MCQRSPHSLAPPSPTQPGTDILQAVLSLENSLRALLAGGENAQRLLSASSPVSSVGLGRYAVGDGHRCFLPARDAARQQLATSSPSLQGGRSNYFDEREVIRSNTGNSSSGGKGPGGVFRPYLQDGVAEGARSGGSGLDPERNRKGLVKPAPGVGASMQLRPPIPSTSTADLLQPPQDRQTEQTTWRSLNSSSLPWTGGSSDESLEDIVDALHKKILLRTVKEAELKMIRRIRES
jgi:hypothetical protein